MGSKAKRFHIVLCVIDNVRGGASEDANMIAIRVTGQALFRVDEKRRRKELV